MTAMTNLSNAHLALLLACTLTCSLACSDEAEQGASSTTSTATGGGGSTGTSNSGGTAGTGGSGGTAVACPDDGLVPGEHQATIIFDGDSREYEVRVPTGYDGVTRVPLLFDIHGYTESKDQQQGQSGFDALAETEGFVVVRPNGTGGLRSFNAGDKCCGSANSEGLDDVDLMRAIALELSTVGCIDSRRVYATGLSNGGAMTHRLGCEAADLFAAIAPVSHPIDFDPLTKCKPSRPIAVMHLHGSGDFIVPINGSFLHQSTHESFAHWVQVNGCSGMPNVSYSQGKSECKTHDNCGGGVQTSLCIIDGPHHLYNNNDNVDIAKLAYDFLKQHTLP